MKRTAAANVVPVRQRNQYNCMTTAMMMCLRANGVSEKETTPDLVNEVMGALPMHGASWEQALACAQHYGMRATLVVPSTVRQLKDWTDRGIPVMIAWNPEGREWSHASVVFDVDDDLNVYVADSNIPDPDETVRVVTKDEFYHRWIEKWPHYLVRRPAMAVEREITEDGRQVLAKKLAPVKVPRLPPANEAGKALSQRSQGEAHHNRDYDAAKGRNRKEKHKKRWEEREAADNVRSLKLFLQKNRIPGEVTGSGSRWEIELPDEKAYKQFSRLYKDGFGGYRTGYGSWIVSPYHYKDKGDYNDPGSAWHYGSQSLSLRPDYGTGDSLGNRLDQAREALVTKVASRYLKGQEK